jgi:hypothetical protein
MYFRIFVIVFGRSRNFVECIQDSDLLKKTGGEVHTKALFRARLFAGKPLFGRQL